MATVAAMIRAVNTMRPKRDGVTSSGNVALIDVFRRLLFALRSHLRRIRGAWNAARPELLPLDVVFGKIRLDAIRFARFAHGTSLVEARIDRSKDTLGQRAGIAMVPVS